MLTPRNVASLVVMQPIAVDTGSPDRDGMLVMADGMLVGVLVQLAAPEHGRKVGRWFVESLYGALSGALPQPFLTLDEATRWFRLQREPRLS